MFCKRLWQVLLLLLVLSTTGCGLFCDRYCDRCYGHNGCGCCYQPCCCPPANGGCPAGCVPATSQQPWTPSGTCR
jgi:hypothetical protein